MKRRILIGSCISFCLIAAVIFALDQLAFWADGCSCSSDNLFQVRELLQEIHKEKGKIPATKENLIEQLVARKGHNYLHCNVDHLEYDYFPDVVNDGNSGIVVKCSRPVHGLITKFSWAVLWNDGRFRFAKLPTNGKVVLEGDISQ